MDPGTGAINVSDFAGSRYQNPPPMVAPGLFRLAAGNYTVRVEHPDFDAHEEGIVVERNGACFEMRLSAPQEPEHDPR